MSRRRAPQGDWEWLAEGTRAQRVGGAGRVPSASPVPEFTQAVAAARLSTAMTTSLAFQKDSWTLSAGGAQTKTLTYLPAPGSEHIYLNGIEQDETVDWSRTGQTLSVLSPMGALTGDYLEARYAYLTGLPATPVNVNGPFYNAAMALSPLAYYRFGDVSVGGTLVDSSGHGHDGVYETGTQSATSGLLTQEPDLAMNIPGTSGDGAHVPSASWMNLTSNITWVFLVKSTDTAARIAGRETSGAYNWSIQLGGPIYLCVNSGIVGNTITTINDGVKHLVVITYDGANVKFYVDGTLTNTVAYAGSIGTAAYDLTIGYGGGTASGYMLTGVLDELIIYNSALTAANVTTLQAAS